MNDARTGPPRRPEPGSSRPRPGDDRSLEVPAPPTVTRFSEHRRSELARRTRDGTLERVRKGVYLTPVSDDGPARRRRGELLRGVQAVEARLTTPHWFSHASAAVVHGCWTWRLSTVVHLTQLRPPKGEQVGETDVVRHWTALPHRDRDVVNGLPVTSLERTVVDCARLLPAAQALVVADSALRGGADRRLLRAILGEAHGRRGVRQARELLALADPRAESPGESVLRWVVHDAGLPAPTVGLEVATRLGSFWVDLGWTAHRVAVEFDGAVKYSGGEYGDPSARVLAEKLRQDALEEAGWTVVRVTWDELSDPATLAARIRDALSRAPRAPRAREIDSPVARSTF